MKIDPRLFEFATVRQLEMLEAVEARGSWRAAAKALGVSKGSLESALKRVKLKAAMQGYAPDSDMQHVVPEGFKVKGVSTLYDADGKPRAQWVKSSADETARLQALREVVAALSAEVPRSPPADMPPVCRSALCNVYTLTDCHVGMLAWRDEGGADWDLEIAERTLTGAFDAMLSGAPSAATCVVNQLGDFLHSDGLVPVTPTSGHVLDQDGRYAQVVRAAVRILRRLVDAALLKHQLVVVLLAEGNHDLAGSVWLRTLFAALYENEPRVHVVESALPYYVHQHGRTLLAFHHGHLTKNANLPLLFAAQFPEHWGATRKRYCHVGHRHHVDEKEHPGMRVVQHATLAARDAYAARGGWYSERQATAITYHDIHGEVARTTVTPEMLA